MPRAGVTAQAVTDAAAELADSEGFETVTLAALAARLGVRPPSLYAHVDGLADVRRRLGVRGAGELADAMQAAAAGRAGGDALAAISDAFRSYARTHPGSYVALQRAPGGEETERVVDTVLAVLAGYGLEGERALHATRAIRSALHGFVLLEAQEGFAMSLPLDESFATLVGVLDRGLRA